MEEIILDDCLDNLTKELNKETYSKKEVLKVIGDCDYIITNHKIKLQQELIDRDKKIIALMEENLRLEGLM